jgi:hypothetical protein
MIHPKGDIYIDFFLFFNTLEQAGYAFLEIPLNLPIGSGMTKKRRRNGLDAVDL